MSLCIGHADVVKVAQVESVVSMACDCRHDQEKRRQEHDALAEAVKENNRRGRTRRRHTLRNFGSAIRKTRLLASNSD